MNTTVSKSLSDELKRIQVDLEKSKKHKKLLRPLKYQLKKYGFDLNSTLHEVMVKGNHMTVDDETNTQSNFLNIFEQNFYNRFSEGRFLDKIIDQHIEDTTNYYERMIYETTKNGERLLKPVVAWERMAIGFYGIKENPKLCL